MFSVRFYIFWLSMPLVNETLLSALNIMWLLLLGGGEYFSDVQE